MMINDLETRDLHGNGDDGNPADFAKFAGAPREWKYNLAGLPRECQFILPYMSFCNQPL